MTEVPQDIKKFAVEEAAKYKNIAIPLDREFCEERLCEKRIP